MRRSRAGRWLFAIQLGYAAMRWLLAERATDHKKGFEIGNKSGSGQADSGVGFPGSYLLLKCQNAFDFLVGFYLE